MTYYLGIEGPVFTLYDKVQSYDDETMLEHSRKYPDSRFTLEYYGKWIKYFKNGEMSYDLDRIQR